MPIDFILIIFFICDGFRRIQNAARVINFLSELVVILDKLFKLNLAKVRKQHLNSFK